jgi:hypothetical protein
VGRGRGEEEKMWIGGEGRGGRVSGIGEKV